MANHTTLRLSEALLRRAKAYARQRQTTLTAVMERALTAYLSAGGAGVEGGPVQLPRFGRGGTRAGIDLDRTSALLDVMDDSE